MACPYFFPKEALADPISGRPRPPLGDFHGGVCSVAPGCRDLPLEICNLGYADRCERFDSGSAPAHAVRFAIAGDDGGVVVIRYCCERDHRPASWGEAVWEVEAKRLSSGPEGRVLRRQIQAYAVSYLHARQPGRDG